MRPHLFAGAGEVRGCEDGGRRNEGLDLLFADGLQASKDFPPKFPLSLDRPAAVPLNFPRHAAVGLGPRRAWRELEAVLQDQAFNPRKMKGSGFSALGRPLIAIELLWLLDHHRRAAERAPGSPRSATL